MKNILFLIIVQIHSKTVAEAPKPVTPLGVVLPSVSHLTPEHVVEEAFSAALETEEEEIDNAKNKAKRKTKAKRK